MVELRLPKNSTTRPGKFYPAPAEAKRKATFQVYRWSPDDDSNPSLDSYELDLDKIGRWFLMHCCTSRTISTRH